MEHVFKVINCSRRWIAQLKENKKCLSVTIFIVIFLDAVLLAAVVPIVPEYLLSLDSPRNNINGTGLNETYTNSTQHTSPRAATIVTESSRIGWLLSSKAITQLAFNFVMSTVINRFGYTVPLLFGTAILMISTTLYALGQTYTVLLIARAIHGMSSSFVSVAGLGLLADTYSDDLERSRAIGRVLGGIALGVLVGYPYGGFLYDFFGKTQLFIILTSCVGFEVLLQCVMLPFTFKSKIQEQSGPRTIDLLKDVQILAAAGVILLPEMAMSMLETSLPLWLIENMDPKKWQLGMVFVPDSLGYFIGCNVFGNYAPKLGRRFTAASSLCMIAVCLFFVPLVPTIYYLIVPHFGIGFALGMSNVAIMPLLANILDTRYIPVYGSVYVIGETAVQLGFALGPPLAGYISESAGFAWAIRSIAVVNLLYCPLCYVLGDIDKTEEMASLLAGPWNKMQAMLGRKPAFARLEEQNSDS